MNAASFLGVLLVLARWRRPPVPTFEVPEDVFGAMRAGARYVRHSLPLRSVLARSAAFVAVRERRVVPAAAGRAPAARARAGRLRRCCSAVSASAPSLGAVVLARLREHFVTDRLMAAATLLFALASATLGAIHDPILAGIVLVGGGHGVDRGDVQHQRGGADGGLRLGAGARPRREPPGDPGQHGGRRAAVGMRRQLGSASPTRSSSPPPGSSAGLVVASRFPLGAAEGLDLSPAEPVPAPSPIGDVAPGDGPVLVTVEYRIDPARADDFVEAIRRLGRIRRRDGAQLWGVFRDAVDPARWLETFTVESWAEHLRQHERVTVSDRELQGVARSFHVGPTRPVVTHYIAAPPREP